MFLTKLTNVQWKYAWKYSCQIFFCLNNKVAFVFEEIIMVMLHEFPLSTFVFVIDRQYKTSSDESKRCMLACYIMTWYESMSQTDISYTCKMFKEILDCRCRFVQFGINNYKCNKHSLMWFLPCFHKHKPNLLKGISYNVNLNRIYSYIYWCKLGQIYHSEYILSVYLSQNTFEWYNYARYHNIFGT